MLLYVGIAGSQRNVYLYRFADGSITRPSTLNEGANYYLTWSADGEEIAFMERATGRYNLKVWNMVSDETVEITMTRTNAMIRWSPDGERIAFVDSTGVNVTGIYMMELNLGEVTPLFGSGRSANIDAPTWSPDGETIAFRSNQAAGIGLYTIPSRGGTPQRITPESLSLVSVPLWRP
jgi:TolB protein